MQFLRDAWAICKLEASLFQRFPKLRPSAIGVVVIPALYALIYLGSVKDPGAHTGELKAAVVNLDAGTQYRGQSVTLGKTVIQSVKDKHTFDFVDYPSEDSAKADVRRGQLAFAMVIPKDFSAQALPGQQAAGGKLVVYVSEGNNYNGAALAKRFASELGHQVNINLNEQRWAFVLFNAEGASDKLTQLRTGAAKLNAGAAQLDAGLAKAETGSQGLATGSQGFSQAVEQLAEGVKQLGGGLRTMDQQRPSDKDLNALKAGAAELVTGHASLAQGLQELQGGATKLTEGSNKLRDESKGIPLVGGRVAEGAGQLAQGATQLGNGLQSARAGQTQLADGTQKLSTNIGKLADGVSALGNGIHQAATKVPADAKLDELSRGGKTLSGGAQELQSGLAQLKAGSHELAMGLNLLNQSLPGPMAAPDGSARGLADSVEPVLEIVAPVPNNGAGFAPNFLATSLWLGAVMSAFLFHLRRLPLAAQSASAPARIFGKLGVLAAIVTAQSTVIMLAAITLLALPVAHLLPFALTLVTTSLTFLCIILALTRAFGDAGKGVALLLMVLQLSSAGGVMPVELAGGIYQAVSPWLPFTWVVKALRASIFDAFDGDWYGAWQMIAVIGTLAWLCACYVGRWKFVDSPEHRPAMDI